LCLHDLVRQPSEVLLSQWAMCVQYLLMQKSRQWLQQHARPPPPGAMQTSQEDLMLLQS